MTPMRNKHINSFCCDFHCEGQKLQMELKNDLVKTRLLDTVNRVHQGMFPLTLDHVTFGLSFRNHF